MSHGIAPHFEMQIGGDFIVKETNDREDDMHYRYTGFIQLKRHHEPQDPRPQIQWHAWFMLHRRYPEASPIDAQLVPIKQFDIVEYADGVDQALFDASDTIEQMARSAL